MKITDIWSVDDNDIILHEEVIDLFEMSNLTVDETGIEGLVVWVNGGGDKLRHGPRIKVSKGLRWDKQHNATIPMTGTPRVIGNVQLSQDQFSQLVQWMLINKPVLLAYHNNQLSTAQMLKQIQPLR